MDRRRGRKSRTSSPANLEKGEASRGEEEEEEAAISAWPPLSFSELEDFDGETSYGLRSTRVVLPKRNVVDFSSDGEEQRCFEVVPATIVVVGERVAFIHRDLTVDLKGLVVRDVGDLVILPGIVDAGARFGENSLLAPGSRSDCWEGFDIGTKAAAAGGITTTIDLASLDAPLAAANDLPGRAKLASRAATVDVALAVRLENNNDDTSTFFSATIGNNNNNNNNNNNISSTPPPPVADDDNGGKDLYAADKGNVYDKEDDDAAAADIKEEEAPLALQRVLRKKEEDPKKTRIKEKSAASRAMEDLRSAYELGAVAASAYLTPPSHAARCMDPESLATVLLAWSACCVLVDTVLLSPEELGAASPFRHMPFAERLEAKSPLMLLPFYQIEPSPPLPETATTTTNLDDSKGSSSWGGDGAATRRSSTTSSGGGGGWAPQNNNNAPLLGAELLSPTFSPASHGRQRTAASNSRGRALSRDANDNINNPMDSENPSRNMGPGPGGPALPAAALQSQGGSSNAATIWEVMTFEEKVVPSTNNNNNNNNGAAQQKNTTQNSSDTKKRQQSSHHHHPRRRCQDSSQSPPPAPFFPSGTAGATTTQAAADETSSVDDEVESQTNRLGSPATRSQYMSPPRSARTSVDADQPSRDPQAWVATFLQAELDTYSATEPHSAKEQRRRRRRRQRRRHKNHLQGGGKNSLKKGSDDDDTRHHEDEEHSNDDDDDDEEEEAHRRAPRVNRILGSIPVKDHREDIKNRGRMRDRKAPPLTLSARPSPPRLPDCSRVSTWIDDEETTVVGRLGVDDDKKEDDDGDDGARSDESTVTTVLAPPLPSDDSDSDSSSLAAGQGQSASLFPSSCTGIFLAESASSSGEQTHDKTPTADSSETEGAARRLASPSQEQRRLLRTQGALSETAAESQDPDLLTSLLEHFILQGPSSGEETTTPQQRVVVVRKSPSFRSPKTETQRGTSPLSSSSSSSKKKNREKTIPKKDEDGAEVSLLKPWPKKLVRVGDDATYDAADEAALAVASGPRPALKHVVSKSASPPLVKKKPMIASVSKGAFVELKGSETLTGAPAVAKKKAPRRPPPEADPASAEAQAKKTGASGTSPKEALQGGDASTSTDDRNDSDASGASWPSSASLRVARPKSAEEVPLTTEAKTKAATWALRSRKRPPPIKIFKENDQHTRRAVRQDYSLYCDNHRSSAGAEGLQMLIDAALRLEPAAPSPGPPSDDDDDDDDDQEDLTSEQKREALRNNYSEDGDESDRDEALPQEQQNLKTQKTLKETKKKIRKKKKKKIRSPPLKHDDDGPLLVAALSSSKEILRTATEASPSPEEPSSSLFFSSEEREADASSSVSSVSTSKQPFTVALGRSESGASFFGAFTSNAEENSPALPARQQQQQQLRERVLSSPLHVARVSTFQTARVLEDCRAHDRACLEALTAPIFGGLTTGSVACQNLLFCEEDVPYGGTIFKVQPPIRHEAHRRALWRALRAGTLAVVTSGHSPVDPLSKPPPAKGDFSRAIAGSLLGANEVFLPAFWTAARPEGFDLVDLANLLAFGPAQLLKLTPRKGIIAPEADADFVIFDPDLQWTVDAATLVAAPSLAASLALSENKRRSKQHTTGGPTKKPSRQQKKHQPASVYDGKRLTGAVVATVLRGRLVYCRGKFRNGPTLGNVITTQGRIVRKADGHDRMTRQTATTE